MRVAVNITSEAHPTPPMPPKKAPRLDCHRVYLTYPQCHEPKEKVLARIVKSEKNLDWAVVAAEVHKDGQPHLHVVIAYSKRVRKSLKAFDYLAKKHGNYQPVKFLKECLAYVQKCGDLVTYGDVPNVDAMTSRTQEKTPKVSDAIALTLLSGASVAEVITTHPGYALLHSRQLDAFALKVAGLRALQSTMPRRCLYLPPGFSITLGGLRSTSLTFRTLQPYIYGPKTTGKTTLLLSLIECYRGFQIPTNNDFQFYDEHYDFAYIDEFKGQLTVQFLNQWLQGSPLMLNTKGSSVMKNRNIPTFIFSNYPLSEVYKDQDKVDTLLSRVQLVPLVQGDWLPDLIRWEDTPTAPNSPPLSPVLPRKPSIDIIDLSD